MIYCIWCFCRIFLLPGTAPTYHLPTFYLPTHCTSSIILPLPVPYRWVGFGFCVYHLNFYLHCVFHSYLGHIFLHSLLGLCCHHTHTTQDCILAFLERFPTCSLHYSPTCLPFYHHATTPPPTVGSSLPPPTTFCISGPPSCLHTDNLPFPILH